MYGIAVRAGAITPQTADEESFRAMIGVAPMGEDAVKAWKDDQGVRRPVTLKSKSETDATIENIEQSTT